MTKSKITKLSDEKWAEIYALREEYRAAGLNTAPADRATTQAVITGFYARIGKPAPAFLWFDGPAASVLAYNVLKKFSDPQLESQLESQLGSQLWSQLGSQLESQLGSQLWSQLGSQLRSQLRSQLGSQLGSQLRSQLGSQLWSQLGSQLGSQLWSQLRSQLESQLRSQLRSQLGSQLESQLRSQLLELPSYYAGGEWLYWVAFYVAAERAGVRYAEGDRILLSEWGKLHRASGWWFPFEGICICSDRYALATFDAEKQLHNETGPAIACRDGYKVYAWHGTRVPAEWIEQRDTLDPATALTWDNIEQRRAAAEIIGWPNVIAKLPHRVIDADADPLVGTLLDVDLPDSPATRFLRVRCPTKRDFALIVPKTCATALDAQLWAGGPRLEFYQPEARG